MLIFNGLENYGLLALRLALAWIFIYHGLPKIKMPSNMAKAMNWPVFAPFLLGLGEFLAGILSLIGFLTEIASLYFAFVMLGALYHKIFKWKAPFSAFDKLGYEFDIIILAASLALMFNGAGAISIDAMLGWI